MFIVRHLLLFLILTSPLHGQWQSVGNVDSYGSRNGNEITVRAGGSLLQINVLADDLFRIQFTPAMAPATGNPGQREDADYSWAVVKSDWPPLKAEITDSPGEITVSTSELTLVVKKKPLRLAFLDKSGAIINQDDPGKGIAWSSAEVRVWKVMPGSEHYYGFGEKAGQFDRRNSHMTMWNSDIPAYTADTDPLYKSIPFFYGLNNGKAYGIFQDNPRFSSFDMGKESRSQYSFGAESGRLNYYFFYGPSPRKILSRFTELVGHMPLPPRWSLGYQQSRWSYTPDSRVRQIARGFRERRIPCDVIYLDIDYMEGFRIFTWNKKNFPEPKNLIDDLARDGFKVAVIVDPGIKADSSYESYLTGLAGAHFLKYPDGKVYIGEVWPGKCAFPDFTNPGTRTWWGRQFSVLMDAGVRGLWNDMNEPSIFNVPTKTIDLNVIHDDNGLRSDHAKNHNIYGMQMTRATYDGARLLKPTERPFVLTRATYAGGQRFSAVWTGDNVASWEHLSMAVSMCLNLSISGHPFVGADIGGFIGYPGGELFARWLQLGVFTPLMRAHSVINEKNKEPWEFGEEFTRINRETINLRYRFLPYIYNTMYAASVSGIPAMQPMVMNYPEEFQNESSQFMFGNDLLIAPVLSEGATEREVTLPGGMWYDYWSGEKMNGGRRVTVAAPLSRIPIFIRGGSAIPMQQVVQYSDQSPIDPLTIAIYPGPFGENSTSYYEDDGLTFRYEQGAYLKRLIDQKYTAEGLTVSLSACQGSFIPPGRSLIIQVQWEGAPPRNVSLDDRKVYRVQGAQLPTISQGWSYDAGSKTVLLKTEDMRTARTIDIQR